MRPPSGASAPTTSLIPGGAAIDLQPLAREICRRFYIRFPDELERSAEPGTAWCQHDNQYLLAWAIQEARDGTISFVEQSLWLARVLHSRGFPLEQLTENLLIASDLARNTANSAVSPSPPPTSSPPEPMPSGNSRAAPTSRRPTARAAAAARSRPARPTVR